MDEPDLRQWVEANPGWVNDRDKYGNTPLYTAECVYKSEPLILWLVKEKGANVNVADKDGSTPLHRAPSLDILHVLLSCGADPTLLDSAGCPPLFGHIILGRADLVARLLQDPRVRDKVNVQTSRGMTAFHHACLWNAPEVSAIVQLLLEAGADLTLRNGFGLTPLDRLQRRHPTHPTTLALVAQRLDADKTSFLVKARRFVMAATRSTPPSYLQGRVARGLPLPRATLEPVTEDEREEEREDEEKATQKLRTTLAWLVGMEGGDMPRDVFRVVLDLLMPWWDPLRHQAPWSERRGQGQSD